MIRTSGEQVMGDEARKPRQGTHSADVKGVERSLPSIDKVRVVPAKATSAQRRWCRGDTRVDGYTCMLLPPRRQYLR